MNNETCVLATLRLGSWSGKKLDRAAANALETQTHSGAGTYEARKTLVSKTWLDRIQRQDTLIRSTFQQFTLAYPATSVRMVPLSAKERLDNCMAALFLERRNIIDANLAGPYQDEIRTAPERLKDAFNESDFPSVDVLRQKYREQYLLLPMPAGWKSGVDDATIAANLEAARAAGFAEAHKDAWDRVIKMTRQVVAKLEDTPKTGRKLSVYETLTENARELVNTLESMIGVIDDSNLESALETLKTMIGAASPEVLRDDERQRYTILGAANNILTNGLAALETGPGIPKKTEAPMPAGIPLPEPEPEPADDFSDLLD